MYHNGCDAGFTAASDGAKFAWNITEADFGNASVTTTTSLCAS